jgi:hypothetical protein
MLGFHHIPDKESKESIEIGIDRLFDDAIRDVGCTPNCTVCEERPEGGLKPSIIAPILFFVGLVSLGTWSA